MTDDRVDVPSRERPDLRGRESTAQAAARGSCRDDSPLRLGRPLYSTSLVNGEGLIQIVGE